MDQKRKTLGLGPLVNDLKREPLHSKASLGDNKKPASGFYVGVKELDANEQYVIHRGVYDIIGDSERMTLERFLALY